MNKSIVAPAIYLYEDVIDNCEEIISLALGQKDDWQDAHTRTSFLAQDGNKTVRDSRVLYLPVTFGTRVEWFLLSQKIWQAVDDYAKEFNVGFSNMESVQILHYEPQSGHYDSHADDGPGLNRIISAVLYLNDVDEGGETHFDHFGVSVSPKRGSMAVFPSNYAYRHEARPSSSQEKFVAVTWFNA